MIASVNTINDCAKITNENSTNLRFSENLIKLCVLKHNNSTQPKISIRWN